MTHPKNGTGEQAGKAKTEGLLRPYAIITARICGMLEQGVVPWRKPWNVENAEPMNLSSGKAYRGVNVFMLESSAAVCGYKSRYWVTFKQALERGGNVRKGEQATPVVFWSIRERPSGSIGKVEESDDGAKPANRTIPFLKNFNVFNVEQCEGVEYPSPKPATARPFDPITECDKIVQAMPRPPTIKHLGNRACYKPLTDEVHMPVRGQFVGSAEYYSTLFHELVHATGHPSRLNRDAIAKSTGFGSAPYAKEELVAEMGAAFLCSFARIEQETLTNSAAYIQGWISRLRSEPKLVVLAAAAAQKAVDYILDGQGRERPAEAESVEIEGDAAAIVNRGFER